MATIIINTNEELKDFVSKNRNNIININGVQFGKIYPMIEVTKRQAAYYDVDSQEYKFLYAPFTIEYDTIEAKEKANELVNTMLDKLYDNGSLTAKRILHSKAVECAKVLADEILHQYATSNAELTNGFYRSEKVVFWQAVRTELDYV